MRDTGRGSQGAGIPDERRTTNDERRAMAALVLHRWSFVTPARLLVLGIVGYITVFTAAAWLKYDTYQMGFDLGVHEQVLWNTAHGRIAATSAFATTESYLGIDIVPTELLLAPIYALAPSAYTMLFLQTLALALGAVPVFLIVRDRFSELQIVDCTLQIDQQHEPRSAIYNLQSTIPNWAGLAFAAAFLLYLPVEYMNLYEFQIRAFATTFLLWAFYALERRRFGPFLFWSLLALGCRSEAGLVLAGMGVYAWLESRTENPPPTNDRRVAHEPPLHSSLVVGRWSFVGFTLLPIVLGLGWFALCLGALIPYFRNGAPPLYLSVIYGQVDGHPWLGDSPGEIFRTLLTRPGFVLQEVFGHSARGPMRLEYLLEMFLPFGFLLLLQPRMLLITLPIFALNLLSNTPNIHASTHYHYQALIIPFMVVGSAYGLHWLVRRMTTDEEPRTENREPSTGKRRTTLRHSGQADDERHTTRNPQPATRWSLVGVVALALACNIGFRNPFFSLLTRPVDRARIVAIGRLLAQVPPDAPLTTTNGIGPHAARRERLFFFPGNVIYPAGKIEQGEYLLVEMGDARSEGRRLLADLAASGRYRRLDEERGVSLWQRVEP